MAIFSLRRTYSGPLKEVVGQVRQTEHIASLLTLAGMGFSVAAIGFSYTQLNAATEVAQSAKSIAKAELSSSRARLQAISSALETNPSSDAAVIRAALELRDLAGQIAESSNRIDALPVGIPAPTQRTVSYGEANIRVDIFICESTPQNERIALNAATAFQRDERAPWRVRTLRSTMNNKQVYRIRSNVIRYNIDERTYAEHISSMFGARFNAPLSLERSPQRTGNYLSIFLCGDSVQPEEATTNSS